MFFLLPYFLSALYFLLLAATPVPASGFDPDPGDKKETEGRPVLQQYLKATRGQDEKLRGLAMDVEIDASVPSLNRKGKFHALRQISKLGLITYRAITFQGDNTIKNDVIARYLQAEKEAAEHGVNLGRTPENYKFKYYGSYGSGGWKLHLFELIPREKKAGLFHGWLWVEARTGLPVREQGEFVKNPSIFLKRVEFVRDYEIRDGVAVPVKVDSQILTRVAGRAEMVIRYTNVAKASDEPPPPVNTSEAR